MGRYTGSATLNNVYNINDYHPLDTRMLVPTFSDLLDPKTWQITGKTDPISYNGMIVAVGNNSDHVGIYYLFDPQQPGADDLPDTTKAENWHKVADLKALEALTARVKDLEDSQGQGGGSGEGVTEDDVLGIIEELIKNNNEFKINASNQLELNEISVSKLVSKDADDVLVLYGGGASEYNINNN